MRPYSTWKPQLAAAPAYAPHPRRRAQLGEHEVEVVGAVPLRPALLADGERGRARARGRPAACRTPRRRPAGPARRPGEGVDGRAPHRRSRPRRSPRPTCPRRAPAPGAGGSADVQQPLAPRGVLDWLAVVVEDEVHPLPPEPSLVGLGPEAFEVADAVDALERHRLPVARDLPDPFGHRAPTTADGRSRSRSAAAPGRRTTARSGRGRPAAARVRASAASAPPHQARNHGAVATLGG